MIRSRLDDLAKAESREIGRGLTGKDAKRESMLVETVFHAMRLARAEHVPVHIVLFRWLQSNRLIDRTCVYNAAARDRRNPCLGVRLGGLDRYRHRSHGR